MLSFVNFRASAGVAALIYVGPAWAGAPLYAIVLTDGVRRLILRASPLSLLARRLIKFSPSSGPSLSESVSDWLSESELDDVLELVELDSDGESSP